MYAYLMALLSAWLSHGQVHEQCPTALKTAYRRGVYLAQLMGKPSDDAMLCHDWPGLPPGQSSIIIKRHSSCRSIFTVINTTHVVIWSCTNSLQGWHVCIQCIADFCATDIDAHANYVSQFSAGVAQQKNSNRELVSQPEAEPLQSLQGVS